MNAHDRRIARALQRLAAPNAMLAPDREGARWGIYPSADRRRRPVARLDAREVRELSASGVLAPCGEAGAMVLSEAGRARVRRDRAHGDEKFLAQHSPIEPRAVVDPDGELRTVRGRACAAALKRLSALRDAAGAPWLNAEEIAAATRLKADWDRGQIGLIGGSDWSAAPPGAVARGPGNAREAALGAHIDARRRVSAALEKLAPQLRRVVERVCLYEEGLEALERQEGWPARSGKIALKLGLAQLASSRAG